jgi:hypothetical protein
MKTRIGCICLALTVLAQVATSALASDYVWWEGEKPARTNFPAQSWFDPQNQAEADKLSGGAWLSSDGKRGAEELFATYKVSVPHAGRYGLWARKFWKHGPFRWRFDGGEWTTCGRDVALADSVSLRTHVGANWVHLGKVDLTKGEHTFELRLLAGRGESATACFDCFCLAPGPFLPNGKHKPGHRSGRADKGYFPWEPPLDGFGDEALLDLRHLNEREAGQAGRIRRDGRRLLLGSGRPVRFWAVNCSSGNTAGARESVDYLARRLAKLGVNMVRYHSPLYQAGDDPARIDPRKLDDLQYFVAAMKREGIYTKLSFYFPLWFEGRREWGFRGYDRIKNNRPFGLLYFEPRMQQVHRAWLKGLLTTENPYTETPLAEDPAVGILEIVNEDSLFFWTFDPKNVPSPYWRKLEGEFAKWLTERYGSPARAAKAWGPGGAARGDGPGRAVLYGAWHMTGGGLKHANPGRRKRMADQVRFLAETQRGFYVETVRHIREDLGYDGLISASNWKTADERLLGAIERWTYTAGDVIDRHGYFGGRHEGEGASYSVRVGHRYADAAAVRRPERLPIQVHQVAGYPHIISELGWTNPNRYRADCTFLSAAYGALQGVDGLYFFAVGSNFVRDSSMAKFGLCSPAIAGTFPAAALVYRRGDVAEGEPALHHRMDMEKLFALGGSPTAAAEALDALRQADVPAGQAERPADFNPLAFYVGPVLRSLTKGKAAKADAPGDISKWVNVKKKAVRSRDGSLLWRFGEGLLTMDTPRAQGAAGFLGEAGAIRLGDVTIDCGNEYAAVIVVSLDDKPLAESRRILVQAMTEEQPYGFRARDGRIEDLGAGPFGVRRIEATVTLSGGKAPAAIALDENGYATDREVTVGAADGGHAVKLHAEAVYHVLRR